MNKKLKKKNKNYFALMILQINHKEISKLIMKTKTMLMKRKIKVKKSLDLFLHLNQKFQSKGIHSNYVAFKILQMRVKFKVKAWRTICWKEIHSLFKDHVPCSLFQKHSYQVHKLTSIVTVILILKQNKSHLPSGVPSEDHDTWIFNLFQTIPSPFSEFIQIKKTIFSM